LSSLAKVAPMHRRLRQPIVIVPVLIVLAIVGVYWVAFRPDDSATASASTTKTVVDVTSGPMAETVSAEGTVAAAATDDLSFSSAGTVTAVNVKAGDTVTPGQVLATIDSAALQADVTSAEASLADANAKLSDDQSSGASSAQIDADTSSVTSANDSLTNAQEALAGASLVATFNGTVAAVNLTVGEELSSSGTGGTGTTGSDSGSGNSTPPVGNGNSGNGNNNNGNGSSDTSSAQIQVVSAGRFTVDLAVDSADIARVAVGQTATVTPSTSSSNGRFGGGGGGGGNFPGLFFNRAGNTGSGQNATGNGSANSGAGAQTTPSTTTASAKGTVTAVSKVADASSGVATYPVTIAFDATGTDFYVGSTVTGAIATQERANVVQVSALAITTTDTGSTVTVAKDGTATGPTEVRTVTTGLTANGSTEITSGLKAGEKVIITINRPGGVSPPSGAGNGGAFPGATRSG
jgi:macrolide-specific efflux system membrane fusion protein